MRNVCPRFFLFPQTTDGEHPLTVDRLRNTQTTDGEERLSVNSLRRLVGTYGAGIGTGLAHPPYARYRSREPEPEPLLFTLFTGTRTGLARLVERLLHLLRSRARLAGHAQRHICGEFVGKVDEFARPALPHL